VVLQLFDSWDDDALVFDKAAAVFADRNKVRRIRHTGAYFTVDGPLNAPRPPQGRPVLFQQASSATREADVVLIEENDLKRPGQARGNDPGKRVLADIPFSLDTPSYSEACANLRERLTSGFLSGGCDGFLLTPQNPSTDIPILLREVAPHLPGRDPAGRRDTGDFRTLLGLARPANRFAKANAHLEQQPS
jgi:hypothetical protein